MSGVKKTQEYEQVLNELNGIENSFYKKVNNKAINLDKKKRLKIKSNITKSKFIINIKKAIIVLFIAIWFLSLTFTSSVKLKKKGTFPIVSIATKNNINEFIKAAVI